MEGHFCSAFKVVGSLLTKPDKERLLVASGGNPIMAGSRSQTVLGRKELVTPASWSGQPLALP